MPRFWSFIFTASMLMAGMSNAQAENISGTYVAQYANAAILLQIVETTGNVITGRMEEVLLSPNKSRISISNNGISGAIGGETIVLKIKPAQSFGGTIPASGTLIGDQLQITGGSGGSSFAYTFERASPSVFNQRVAWLEAIATKNSQIMLLSASIKKRELIYANNLHQTLQTAQDLHRDSDQATDVISKLGILDSKFSMMVDKMRASLTQESAIIGPNSGIKRAEIADAIYGDGDEIQGIADSITGLKNSIYYTTHDTNIQDGIKHAQLFCAGQITIPACIQFASANQHYQQSALDVAQALHRTMLLEKQAFEKRKLLEKQAVDLERQHG